MDNAFIELSAALTGYSQVEITGTGVSEAIWKELVKQKGEALAGTLLQAWNDHGDAGAILADPALGPAGRELMAAWYTGQWGASLFDASSTISSQTYIQALIWKAAKAHPMGAKQPGFGTWSFPPDYLERIGS